MRKVMLVLLLLAAHLNLTALVPLLPGDPPPPWWVGGMLLWPFDVATRTLIKGDSLNALTPILGISSAVLFLLAVAAFLRKWIPERWFPWLIISGTALSIVLQVIWISGWAIFPLLVDVALLWAVFNRRVTVQRLHA